MVVSAMRLFAWESIRNNRRINDGRKEKLGVAVYSDEISPFPIPDAGPESAAFISLRESRVSRCVISARSLMELTVSKSPGPFRRRLSTALINCRIMEHSSAVLGNGLIPLAPLSCTRGASH
jgi:hypothetical protein